MSVKSKSHLLLIAAVFAIGLFTGLLLRGVVAPPIYLTAHEIVVSAAYKEADFPLPTVGQIIDRAGYTVCYDARSKNPYYVVEVLTAESLKGNADRAAHEFKEDENIPGHLRATLEDYRESGLDRGHQAPAADHKKSVQHMRDTFYLSNICPQNPALNRNYWAVFERHVRDLTKHYKTVQVITGPLYVPRGEPGKRFFLYNCIGKNDVAVPNAFFKVILLEQESGSFEEHAYIVPNAPVNADTPLAQFETTIEKVERLSGIIFH